MAASVITVMVVVGSGQPPDEHVSLPNKVTPTTAIIFPCSSTTAKSGY
jgi:hypothetical protein